MLKDGLAVLAIGRESTRRKIEMQVSRKLRMHQVHTSVQYSRAEYAGLLSRVLAVVVARLAQSRLEVECGVFGNVVDTCTPPRVAKVGAVLCRVADQDTIVGCGGGLGSEGGHEGSAGDGKGRGDKVHLECAP